ncbi:hypothetical protein D9619_009565 [Psilocybe cf. subviscida]|uniref:Major facilitator superfamily (MFS) profile domain-containing protein n=1 Tax=Psilocybe cf. subviscida TaxID=2480587 RepID=A0A8H5BKK5_9AGAR|nr:hypothetical protein D9619_009565 [Psilocybe cf. subviscida]
MSRRDVAGAPHVAPGQGSDTDWETTLHQLANLAAGFEKKTEQGQDQVFDCGKNAWMTVAGTWMVQFCTYGYVSAFGIYQDYYTRSFLSHSTPSDISWIGSFQLFMQYAPGILVGWAFDAGYFRHMIALGSIIQILSMFMLSLARAQSYYEVFLAQAVGMGIGQSLLFLPSLTIIGRHFRARRSLATGIAVSGASVGGVVWPIMLSQLSRWTSFANAVRATASLAAGLLVAANLLMSPGQSKGHTVPTARIVSIIRDVPYMVSIASFIALNLTRGPSSHIILVFYLQLYAVDIGISHALAFYSVGLLNAGSVLGRLLPNIFADKIGPYNMLLPCLFMSSALAFAMMGIKNFTGVAVFAILYGFWSGSYVSLIPSLLAQFSKHAGEHGIRMGIAFSIVGISLLIGTPIEGALLHSQQDEYEWYRPIIFCGVSATFSNS